MCIIQIIVVVHSIKNKMWNSKNEMSKFVNVMVNVKTDVANIRGHRIMRRPLFY